MTTPVAEDPDEGCWYGYGLNLRSVAGRRWIGHSGGMVGHHAQLWCDLDAGLAAAALVNGPAGAALLAEHALRLAAGDEVAEPDLDGLSDPAAAVVLDTEPAEEWRPMCGLYRSHNPWSPTLVVGTCDGAPVAMHWGEAWPLEPLADGSFRLGARLEPRAGALRHAHRRPLRARLARRDRLPPARYVRIDIGGGGAAGSISPATSLTKRNRRC